MNPSVHHQSGELLQPLAQQPAPGLQIRVGFEIEYECPAPTPMILALHIHYSHAGELVVPDRLHSQPAVPVSTHRDLLCNWCSRLVAP